MSKTKTSPIREIKKEVDELSYKVDDCIKDAQEYQKLDYLMEAYLKLEEAKLLADKMIAGCLKAQEILKDQMRRQGMM